MGKLNKQQQQLLALVCMMIFSIYLYWTYLLNPTQQLIKEKQVKLEELLKKIETTEQQARRLPLLKEELAKLEFELGNLEKQLPKDKDLPNIIRLLTREAQQENLQFIRLTPKSAQTRDYFTVIPFDVEFTGSLHNLARFLSSLGQQERIFQAQNINLSPGSNSNSENLGLISLTIRMTLQTFSYNG